jgi:hypothetical protein
MESKYPLGYSDSAGFMREKSDFWLLFVIPNLLENCGRLLWRSQEKRYKLLGDCQVVEEQNPNLRKVGAYLFGFCWA